MTISIVLGLILGVVIGAAFAWMQLQALRRNELLEKKEKLPTLLKQMPDSAGRCAFLMVCLVGVQILFPSADKIAISVGFVGAYAIPFLWRLRIKYLQGR